MGNFLPQVSHNLLTFFNELFFGGDIILVFIISFFLSPYFSINAFNTFPVSMYMNLLVHLVWQIFVESKYNPKIAS